jgi:hypothetical protein
VTLKCAFVWISLLVSVTFSDKLFTVEYAYPICVGTEYIWHPDRLFGIGVGVRKYDSLLVSPLLVGYPGKLTMMFSPAALISDKVRFAWNWRLGISLGTSRIKIVPNVSGYLCYKCCRVGIGILLEVAL